eukprot:UN26837
MNDTGKDCKSAWKITRKLLPTITACPAALAAQCPKTCGQCPDDNYHLSFNSESELITTEFTFPDADYKLLIGDRKAGFLKECSEVLKPVKCVEAVAGSVIVTVNGKLKDLEKQADHLKTHGLQLPNFGNFGKLLAMKLKPIGHLIKKHDSTHDSDVFNQGETTEAPQTTSDVSEITGEKT